MNLDEKFSFNVPHHRLIKFVKDRKGHDFRYSINYQKVKKTLNFSPSVKLHKGIKRTVDWYIQNYNWLINKSRS